MICFLRCQPISEDIRLKKYIQACEKESCTYFAFTWDRLKKNVRYSSYEIQFHKKALYGKLMRNLFNKILWQFYLIVHLIKYRKKYKIIHACNFDTIVPALFMKLFFKKKVIYDVYDALGFVSNGFLPKILLSLDHFFIRSSDLLILADEKRMEQMGLNDLYRKKLLVVENVPVSIDIPKVNYESIPNKIVLSYVGVLDLYRGLETMLRVVEENPKLYLNIAGTGTLENLIKSSAKRCQRITYYGRVPYEEGLKIMESSDLMLGMYYPVVSNHVYAAPNKFFESLFLGKPMITSKGTLVGSKVEKYTVGYVIDSTYEATKQFFLSFDKNSEEYDSITGNAIRLWKLKYEKYFVKVLRGEYIEKLVQMSK